MNRPVRWFGIVLAVILLGLAVLPALGGDQPDVDPASPSQGPAASGSPEVPATEGAAQGPTGADSNKTPSAPTLAKPAGAHVELVLVPVSVHDAKGNPVLGLSREAFTLYEDGAPRDFTTFDPDPTPVALALGLDVSGSMIPIFPFVRTAAITFLEKLPDSFSTSFVTFGETVDVETEFTTDRGRLYYAINQQRANGAETALFEAIQASIVALGSRPGRRVAVLFTDGDDSLVAEKTQPKLAAALASLARGRGVMLFFVVYGETEHAGLLKMLAEQTGGALVPIGSGQKLAKAFATIGRELATQYTLGIAPTDTGAPKTWHTLHAEVRGNAYSVSSRPGYLEIPK